MAVALYVLVDLKIGKLTHQGLGQMQMCVTRPLFDRHRERMVFNQQERCSHNVKVNDLR